MNYVEIDGVAYDVLVTQITRQGEIKQSENYGTTLAEGNPETLDPLGTYITHTVTFRRKSGKEAMFDSLWDTLHIPRFYGVPVKIAYNQTTLEYLARFQVAPQSVRRIDKKNGKTYWNEMVVTIIPTQAQITPQGV